MSLSTADVAVPEPGSTRTCPADPRGPGADGAAHPPSRHHRRRRRHLDLPPARVGGRVADRVPTDLGGYRTRSPSPTGSRPRSSSRSPTAPSSATSCSAARTPGPRLEIADQARDAQAELGWVLDPAHTGHGYATEACVSFSSTASRTSACGASSQLLPRQRAPPGASWSASACAARSTRSASPYTGPADGWTPSATPSSRRSGRRPEQRGSHRGRALSTLTIRCVQPGSVQRPEVRARTIAIAAVGTLEEVAGRAGQRHGMLPVFRSRAVQSRASTCSQSARTVRPWNGPQRSPGMNGHDNAYTTPPRWRRRSAGGHRGRRRRCRATRPVRRSRHSAHRAPDAREPSFQRRGARRRLIRRLPTM